MKTWIVSSLGQGKYSREESIQGRKLYEEMRYACFSSPNHEEQFKIKHFNDFFSHIIFQIHRRSKATEVNIFFFEVNIFFSLLKYFLMKEKKKGAYQSNIWNKFFVILVVQTIITIFITFQWRSVPQLQKDCNLKKI